MLELNTTSLSSTASASSRETAEPEKKTSTAPTLRPTRAQKQIEIAVPQPFLLHNTNDKTQEQQVDVSGIPEELQKYVVEAASYKYSDPNRCGDTLNWSDLSPKAQVRVLERIKSGTLGTASC